MGANESEAKLRARAAQLRLDAAEEMRGLHKEWPHHADQARRSAHRMIEEAAAIERELGKEKCS